MVIEELFTRLGFQVDPKGIDKAKTALSGFKKWVGGLALGAGFVALAKTGVEAAMTIENLTTDFEVMAGSAEKAKSLLGGIADFAKATPFDKIGLSGAAKTLMQFGIESEKVLPTLKMLGDVSMGDQNKLNGLALVFGQIQSTGRLMGQDLLQLINQGFNPLTEISKQTGMSVADLKTAMEEGAISADMVTLAFKSATSAGGLFYNGLEKRSQTLEGKISTLKDNFVTALQRMAEAFLPLMKSATDMLIAFDWTPIVDSVRSFAVAISSIPFDSVVTWVRRLSILVVAFATRDLQKTLLTAFARASEAGLSAFSGMTLSFTSFRNIAVTGAKSIGLAMKTALGPIGLALMAIEGFVEAYNWLENRARKKATEEQKTYAKQFLDQSMRGGKTREQVVREQVEQQEGRKARVKRLQEIASEGGDAGRKAAQELAGAQLDVNRNASFVHALQEVYKDITGTEFEIKPGMVKTPAMNGNTEDLKKAFAELEKSIKENTKATTKNTKAKEKPPFDITALSRQAFDAAFNVKLRELTLGAI